MIRWLGWLLVGDRQMSPAWLESHRRSDLQTSAHFEGVSWSRPYDQFRDDAAACRSDWPIAMQRHER